VDARDERGHDEYEYVTIGITIPSQAMLRPDGAHLFVRRKFTVTVRYSPAQS